MDNTLTSTNSFSTFSEVNNMDSNTLVNIESIIGTAEVAAILQCPKQQIYTLRKRKDFPQPIRTLAATPLWDATDISKFANNWVRRKKRNEQSA
jgi:predicted DNA-binding transcriptional regulator AlpA